MGLLDTPGYSRAQSEARYARFNTQAAFTVDPQSVYGEHIRTASPSTVDHYIHAFGQDAGLGGIILVSSKVAGAAAAVKLVQNPGSSVVHQTDAYATVAHHSENMFAGSAGHYLRFRAEKGYTDGSMSLGANADVLTSATAAFTVGDVGATVSAISYSRTVFGPESGGITATVIAYISPTQVQLSRPCVRTENPMYFTITNRAPSASQNIWQVIATDGTTVKYKFAHDWFMLNGRLIPAADNLNGLFIDTPTTQSAHPFRVRIKDEGDVSREAVYIGNLGHLNAKIGTLLDNSGRPTSSAAALQVKNLGTSGTGKALDVWSNDVVDTVQYRNAAGTLKGRVNYDSRNIIMHTSAPGDSQLSASELTIWFDPTVGATKVMFKGKDSAGTVKTGSVTLS